MVGDYGGGGMMLAYGMVCAILSAQKSGRGQVVDCAMVDGAALMMSMLRGLLDQGLWRDEHGVNALDTGSHFYDTYETADGKFITLGALEPQFYATFRKLAGLEADSALDAQMDPGAWPVQKVKLEALFKTRSRDEWCALLEHSDACFAPVLSMREAPAHPHNQARKTFVDVGGVAQPAPAPRYSATPTPISSPAVPVGADTATVLKELDQ